MTITDNTSTDNTSTDNTPTDNTSTITTTAAPTPEELIGAATAAPTPEELIGAATAMAPALRAAAAARDLSGETPSDVFEQLRAVGITAALVPCEAGGSGASHAEMGRLLRILGAADPSVALTLSMHAHLLGAQVWRHRHGMDATQVFDKVRAGAILISTGASDWLGSSGTAVRVDGGYVVSGRKAPASGCEIGDVLVTSIRWDEGPDGPQVLHCSMPLAVEGVSVERTWDTTGLRATGSHTVVIDDVFVPDAAVSLVRPADVWHPIWNVVLGTAMPLIMAAYVGVADAAVAATLDACGSADERADAHLNVQVGEMINAHITAADVVDAMFTSSDDLNFDNVDDHTAHTLSRKTVASDALIDTVRLALEICGGRAFTRGHDVERLFRDVHGSLFHPLPRARQLQLTGRVVRGLAPVA